MAISQLNGSNYAVDGERITFFDSQGGKFGADSWDVNYFEADPSSMMPAISECIGSDVASGNEDKIAMLRLSSHSAVIFYLEGRLTRQHLTKATEGPDHIDIPDVDIDGRIVTVRVLRETEHSVATADSEGNVL